MRQKLPKSLLSQRLSRNNRSFFRIMGGGYSISRLPFNLVEDEQRRGMEAVMEKLTISEAFDRIGMTKTITLISILTGITICFNGFDYMIVSFSMPQIKAEWGLDSVQMGALSSWGTFGMIFGTLACGRLADMFGRRIVTVAFVGLFSLATFPVIFVNSYEVYCVLRFVCGFGLGSTIPVITTSLAEYCPTDHRGRMVAARSCFNAVGYLLAGLASAFVIPHFGWRICYLFGSLPFFYALWLWFKLPETPFWLMSKGRIREAADVLNFLQQGGETQKDVSWTASMLKPSVEMDGKPGFLALFRGNYLWFTVVLVAIEFMKYFEAYGFNAWMPTVMLFKGFDVSTAYMLSTAQYAAAIISAIVCGYGVDWFGRKWNILIGFMATAAGVVFLVFAEGVPMLLAANLFVGFARTYTSVSVQPLIVETYRTEIRSTGMALCAAVGKIAGVISPIIGGAIMMLGFGASESMLFYALPCVIGGLLVLLIRQDTKGVSLDEMSEIYAAKKPVP